MTRNDTALRNFEVQVGQLAKKIKIIPVGTLPIQQKVHKEVEKSSVKRLSTSDNHQMIVVEKKDKNNEKMRH